MAERRRVTPEEFAQITCNRCGACCEVVWQPTPLAMATILGRNVVPGDLLSWWSDLEPLSEHLDRIEGPDFKLPLPLREGWGEGAFSNSSPLNPSSAHPEALEGPEGVELEPAPSV